ncbi:MAG: hypothetical protein H6709_19075 [Kofleriaceae bacterium]|nr:hypothetical protein [Myxococcales bacterium]MCB9561381.1 hypothetical protein [Kofleriaceae bacterium]MCB9574193.1 hypothetical protein [Kofleriaceae bacterium]
MRARRPTLVIAAAALAALAAGCGSFEDPTIVIDLRALAMTAEPPEQVVALDPTNPPDPGNLDELGLVDVEVCGLIADPGADRALDWTMTVCGPRGNRRCDDPDRPSYPIGSGRVVDPEGADRALPCATVAVEPGLLVVLEDAIREDPLGGFGQVDLQVELKVTPVDGDAGGGHDAIYAAKRVRYAAQLPAERTANHNPTLDRIDYTLADGDTPTPLPLGRCVDGGAPLVVAPGDRLTLEPIEPDGVREDYVVPTFDGGSRMFTETLTYQWLATDGGWTRGSSGGPRDASGTPPPLDSTWKAPPAADLDGPTDVTLWLVQRDERLGEAWYEACVRVEP